VESHGGYVCQYEEMDVPWLQRVARRALAEDGEDAKATGLLVTMIGGPRIVRFAWDAAFAFRRSGAQWYLSHHALARHLSLALKVTVHAYAFDSEELEQVVTYACGRRVGGEMLSYHEVELPEDDGAGEEEAFRRLQAGWPLGHLARVLGIGREELLKVRRRSSAVVDLGRPMEPKPLWQLLPANARFRRPLLVEGRERRRASDSSGSATRSGEWLASGGSRAKVH